MFDLWREDTLVIMWLAYWMLNLKPRTIGKWADNYVDGIVASKGAIDFLQQLGWRVMLHPPSQKVVCVEQDGTRTELWT